MANQKDEEFFASLLVMFNEEANEHVQKLSNLLIQLENEKENDQKKQIVENAFREAHSLKGASRSVSKKNIELLCKGIESVFAVLKSQLLELDDLFFKTIHETVDLISNIIGKEDQNEYLPKIESSLNQLDALALKLEKIKSGLDTTVESPMKQEQIPPKEEKPEQEKNIEEKLPENLEEKKEIKAEKKEQKRVDTADKTKISVDKLVNTISNIEEFLYLKNSYDKYIDYSNELYKLQNELKKSVNLEQSSMEFLKEFETVLNQNLKSLKNDKKVISSMVDNLLVQSKELLLFPFGILLETFPKMAYDMSQELNKKVSLQYSGEDIEIDKRILDSLKDPFLHILRNIIDHGIEDPEERASKGKDIQGKINIKIAPIENSKVKIIIEDDGRGFDIEKIVSSALKNKTVISKDIESMSETEKLNLAFNSGITTNEMVTNYSGRGLGLAIVKEKIVQLSGDVYLSKMEQGSCLTIILPLIIATYRGILVKQNDHKFIIPLSSIEQTLSIKEENIQSVEGSMVVFVQNEMLPLYFLNDLLGFQTMETSSVLKTLIVEVQNSKILLAVDEIVEELEVLIKNLGSQLQKLSLISGATVLNDGSPALILNPLDILSLTNNKRLKKQVPEKEKKENKKSILMVDDSLTTRMLMKNILESSGYDVSVAVDGMDAVSILMQKKIELVVSDVDMPNMNGFELTEKIKSDPNFEDIPVILLTSLESKEDKEKGMDAGENAYIVKSGFDQKNLMETIEWMI